MKVTCPCCRHEFDVLAPTLYPNLPDIWTRWKIHTYVHEPRLFLDQQPYRCTRCGKRNASSFDLSECLS
jgi:hypothetical protein